MRGVTMRKLFWCGCLLSVVAAGAVFWMAEYAESHPESPLGWCARAGCRMVETVNPVAQAARVVAELRTKHAATGGLCDAAGCTRDAALDEPTAPVEVIEVPQDKPVEP